MRRHHLHILQGRSQIARQSPTPVRSAAPPASVSHAICKPMDLGSSRCSCPRLTQLCPNVISSGDPMPAYQERTSHSPTITPSKINRFIITQLFDWSKTSYSYGKNQPAPWPMPPARAPQKGRGSVAISRVAVLIPAVQRDSANLYHLFCFPRFGLRCYGPR